MRSWRSAIVLMVALAAGCGSEGSEEGGTALEEIPGRPCPDGSVLTWESFGGPFLSDHCTGCHSSQLPADGRQGAPVGVELDTREGAMAWRDRIYARAADANAGMPPAGGPGAEERVLLGDWLTCGMP